jgi:hypothetical protein
MRLIGKCFSCALLIGAVALGFAQKASACGVMTQPAVIDTSLTSPALIYTSLTSPVVIDNTMPLLNSGFDVLTQPAVIDNSCGGFVGGCLY